MVTQGLTLIATGVSPALFLGLFEMCGTQNQLAHSLGETRNVLIDAANQVLPLMKVFSTHVYWVSSNSSRELGS